MEDPLRPFKHHPEPCLRQALRRFCIVAETLRQFLARLDANWALKHPYVHYICMEHARVLLLLHAASKPIDA